MKTRFVTASAEMVHCHFLSCFNIKIISDNFPKVQNLQPSGALMLPLNLTFQKCCNFTDIMQLSEHSLGQFSLTIE